MEQAEQRLRVLDSAVQLAALKHLFQRRDCFALNGGRHTETPPGPLELRFEFADARDIARRGFPQLVEPRIGRFKLLLGLDEPPLELRDALGVAARAADRKHNDESQRQRGAETRRHRLRVRELWAALL